MFGWYVRALPCLLLSTVHAADELVAEARVGCAPPDCREYVSLDRNAAALPQQLRQWVEAWPHIQVQAICLSITCKMLAHDSPA